MKRTAIVIAAAMALGGAGICSASTSNNATAMLSQTNKPHAVSSIESPRAAFPAIAAKLTQAALTPGDMNHLIGQFSMGGQAEITQSAGFSQGYGNKLDSQIRELSKNWKAKYGDEFTMQKAEQAFSEYATISESQIGHHAVVLTVRGHGALPQVAVPLVYGSTGWKLNVPKNLTVSKVRQNLYAEISDFNRAKAEWPAKETAAYRAIGHRVFMAVLNIPAPRAERAQATVKNAEPAVALTPAKSAVVRTISTTSSPHHWWQFWTW